MRHISRHLQQVELRLQAQRDHEDKFTPMPRLLPLIPANTYRLLVPLFAKLNPEKGMGLIRPTPYKPILLLGSHATRITILLPDPSAT